MLNPTADLGKHIDERKVMSLRNIVVTLPYTHNGVFATLEQIVHFYTRATSWVTLQIMPTLVLATTAGRRRKSPKT